MLTSGRFVVVLVALLQLCSCQVSTELDCECTQNANRSVAVELDCTRTQDGILEVACRRAEVGSIPAGYSLVEGFGLYKLYRQAAEWQPASSFCEADGGRLAILQDETQYAALVEMLNAVDGVNIAWLGINDINEEGTFVDEDGSPAPYLPWRVNQPDNHLDIIGRGENCVELRRDGINDIHCTDQVPFICEISLAREDYSWVGGARRFVKVHTESATWSEAQAACEAEGASLAVLEDWDRSAAVLEVLPDGVTTAWVGFSDAADEGDFVSPAGRRLSDMSFANWDKDEPNNGLGEEEQDCIALNYKGWYNDLNCDTANSFICEIRRP